jgi:hypothetical protein
MAVPGGSRLRLAAIGCYPAHTWKKRCVRLALGVAARTGMFSCLFPAREMTLPTVAGRELEGWLDQVGRSPDGAGLHPVFVWPADPARGRIYLHLLADDGRLVGFCKIGLDSKNNSLIGREQAALERLAEMNLALSRVPRVLASGCLNNHAYLVVEAAPADARVTDWRGDLPLGPHIAEYAGPSRQVERADLDSLDWWREARRCFADNCGFLRALDDAARGGVAVCRAHGDLNRTNILRHGSGPVWLLDWEQSSDHAPVLTDQVCAAVDALWLSHPGDPVVCLRKLMEGPPFLTNSCPPDAVLALAFLGAAGFTPALAIIGEWFPQG